MCGRYTLHSPKEDIESHFDAKAEHNGDLFKPRYNIAPGTINPVVVPTDAGHLMLTGYRWGLIPPWAEDENTGYNMINARAETLREKKTFQKPFQYRRCIIPANGFFEWKGEQQQKQPFYIRLLSEELIGFAGLFERWAPKGQQEVYSYTIITTEANALVSPLHDRMPVILKQDDYETWLDPQNEDLDELQSLLVPYDEITHMATYRVTDEVNTPENDKPELIQPIPK